MTCVSAFRLGIVKAKVVADMHICCEAPYHRFSQAIGSSPPWLYDGATGRRKDVVTFVRWSLYAGVI